MEREFDGSGGSICGGNAEVAHLKHGLFGKMLFTNSLWKGAGVFGYTLFIDYITPIAKQGIFGYTYFYAKEIFPPENVAPSYSFMEAPGFNTTIIDFGTGITSEIPNDVDVRFTYMLTWDIMTDIEAEAVKDFFLARKGSFERFFFKHPLTGEEMICRFAEDLVDIEYFNYKLYKLKEVSLLALNEIIKDYDERYI